jgi:DNA invertase Pin-like site-specific DNA recombinase
MALGRKRARELGYEVVREYYDNDVSASQYSNKERPDWEKVERDINDGLADVLWVWEISRGTRDLVVWAHLAQACQEHKMWIALDDEEYDTTKPRHMKQLNDLAVDAVYESGKTHERVRRDTEANAERGGVHGPWGYGFRHQFDPHSGEFLRRIVYEPEAKHVREMAQRYLSGEGLSTIAADLNRRRVPTATGLAVGDPVLDHDGNPVVDDRTGEPKLSVGWYYQVIKQILLRASMIGKRSYKGKIILDQGGHQPIFDGTVVNGLRLDEAAWWQVRKKLMSSSPSLSVSLLTSADRQPSLLPRDGSAKRLLGGIVECGPCGALLYPTPLKRSPHGWVYRCEGRHQGAGRACVVRTGPYLDRAVETLLVARFARPDALEAFRQVGPSSEEVGEARACKAALEVEMEELVTDVEAGVVSRRLAAADERRIEAELDRLGEVLRPDSVEPLAVELADLSATVVQQTWRGWSLHQRRRALRVLTRRVVVWKLGAGRRNVPPSEYVDVDWGPKGS